MKDSTKKYLKVSLTLAGICAVSALAIGGVNLLTADTIKANEKAEVDKGLRNIYPDATFSDTVEVNDENNSDIVSYWIAKENEEERGYIFKGSGKNSYGGLTILIGISGEAKAAKLGTIYLVSSEQTRTDFIDKYIAPYNSGNDKETDIDSVKCGATYAATLIQTMAKEAKSVYGTLKGGK